MNKILLIILTLFAFQIKAQTYQESIAQHRETYKNEFLENAEGPVKKEDFSYFDFYEPDTLFRVKCKFKIEKKPSTFKIPTVDGKQKEYFKYGVLSFEIKGKKLILNVYRSLSLMSNPKYRNYLFIPFKDFTSGKETYGGGRYLDLQTTDIQGDSVILDFNKAYNPYCAFSSGYSCPIPPKENHLKANIEAGEKNFKKAH
ncbi:hypothetical protein LV89_02533 [Arcicella aurantiaca]|uniref:DUF1684 domain-containing protein n=1 Tax=Arcicella aurantiaca TaxID=591202 RepID=A0A316E9W1_9BACT|nr:DUF1684 domain-containing protein [Arcicella aurantiaca]PWK26362.1 hypothetical protein LV89_02533 [Arcicella aurantiaca]